MNVLYTLAPDTLTIAALGVWAMTTAAAGLMSLVQPEPARPHVAV